MAKGIFISTNMKSTKGVTRIYDAVSTVELENGQFGYLTTLATGEEAIYNFVVGKLAGKEIVVIDQPVWSADESHRANQRKDKFVIPAGTAFRVRVIAINDEFAVNTAAVTTATASAMIVGAFVTIDATGKLIAAASAGVGTIFEGTVMRKKIQGGVVVTSAHTYGYSTDIFEVKVTTLA